jgi:hypothetical protein
MILENDDLIISELPEILDTTGRGNLSSVQIRNAKKCILQYVTLIIRKYNLSTVGKISPHCSVWGNYNTGIVDISIRCYFSIAIKEDDKVRSDSTDYLPSHIAISIIKDTNGYRLGRSEEAVPDPLGNYSLGRYARCRNRETYVAVAKEIIYGIYRAFGIYIG